jgi:squalene-hopene/tetraprenyl-beta-curcumene cyclase
MPGVSATVNRSEFRRRLDTALFQARRELLGARAPGGHWVGELSSSALSTATAVCALATAEKNSAIRNPQFAILIPRGLAWLAQHQNSDGGWGDTTISISNISTTALGWAAFGMAPGADEKFRDNVARSESWLAERAGGIDPEHLAPAIISRYGKDRTFSVPILMTCVLGGRLGPRPEAWRRVLPLPFELAACPHRWFAALRLPVVSYALPALIAIGQARHHHLPSRNPFVRLTRTLARSRTLTILRSIQPASGGFLEATPLTSFVVMSLACAGNAQHPVARQGVEFLVKSARADGSWPIDTNLATWVTTLAVNALGSTDTLNISAGAQAPTRVSVDASPADAAADTAAWRISQVQHCGEAPQAAREARAVPTPTLPSDAARAIREWLLAQQYREEHPYTHAAPGGWAWTDLPGGVPDADDTAGAALALRNLGEIDDRTRASAVAGINWLLNLQNRDGGIPTFCRGWGALPFDRSSPDLTAHALRAWAAWRGDVPAELQLRIDRASVRAVEYLKQTQRADGSWVPLWFGNQFAPDDQNATYGTARVVVALQKLASSGIKASEAPLRRGIEWLLRAQNPDGAWSGFPGGTASIEETALALEALVSANPNDRKAEVKPLSPALVRGTRWLVEQIESGAWRNPSPIGFYFARLWYHELLYPMIFTVAALTGAERSCRDV